jgi:hypothetical protein
MPFQKTEYLKNIGYVELDIIDISKKNRMDTQFSEKGIVDRQEGIMSFSRRKMEFIVNR